MELLNLCRICLRDDGNLSNILKSIARKVDESSTMALEFFEFLSEILLNDESNLHGKICQQCQSIVENMFSLLVQCEKANKILCQIKPSSVQLRKFPDDFLKRIKVDYPDIDAKDTTLNITQDDDNPVDTIIVIECSDATEPSEKLCAELAAGRFEAAAKKDQSLEESLTNVADDLAEILGEDFDIGCVEDDKETIPLQEDTKSHQTHYACFLCKNSIEVDTFALHLRSHIAEASILFNIQHQTVSCSECPEVSTNVEKYMEHMSIKHGFDSNAMKMQCEVCGGMFDRIEAFIYHRDTHTELKKYECRNCSRNGLFSHEVFEHLQQHIDEYLEKFPDVRKSMVAKNTMRNSTNVQCSLCNNQYITRTHLRNHLLEEHDPYKPGSCEVCNEELLTQVEINAHISSCRKEIEAYQLYDSTSMFSCHNCKASFQDKTSLKDHLHLHLISPFRCKQCSRYFRTESLYDRHACQRKDKNSLDIKMQDAIGTVDSGVSGPLSCQRRKARRLYRAKRPMTRSREGSPESATNKIDDSTVLATAQTPIAHNPILCGLLEQRLQINTTSQENLPIKVNQDGEEDSKTNSIHTNNNQTSDLSSADFKLANVKEEQEEPPMKIAKLNDCNQKKLTDSQQNVMTFIPEYVLGSNTSMGLNILPTNNLIISNVLTSRLPFDQNGLQLNTPIPPLALNEGASSALSLVQLIKSQNVQTNQIILPATALSVNNDSLPSNPSNILQNSQTIGSSNAVPASKPKISVRNDLMAAPSSASKISTTVPTNTNFFIADVRGGVDNARPANSKPRNVTRYVDVVSDVNENNSDSNVDL